MISKSVVTRTSKAKLRLRTDDQLISRITANSKQLSGLSDTQLQSFTKQLRENILRYSTFNDDLFEAGLSLVNESIRRVHGICLYDVQLLAGLVLSRGGVAEMATGEGKTLTAALPALMHALKGRGVHVATSNAYLAERDYNELSPVFRLLGLSVGLIEDQGPPHEKRAAYAADITYGTGHEFGFDYLRDQTALRSTIELPLGQRFRQLFQHGNISQPLLQRGLSFVIVDEIDNVLLDDAVSPLLLSEPASLTAEDAEVHMAASRLVDVLEQGVDFLIVPITKEIRLTSSGMERVHQDVDHIPMELLLRPWSDYVNQALRAKYLMRRNVEYIVQNDCVCIVDESTGRIFEDRSWSDGLHQAVEAKEQLNITSEKKALARITRQRFYKLYAGICGMTGTATGSEKEFQTVYGIDVQTIPLQRPSQRIMLPTRYFPTADSKWEAIADDVKQRHQAGQPILIGTRNISDSETLSGIFQKLGLPFQLLNGRQDADEAQIISGAGERGTITIATNLAGRGTDIKPSHESLALGGLHVIGTERHQSNRIDRQLIGRSGRKGDPGSAQFFVSAEDMLPSQEAASLATRIQHQTRRGDVVSKFDNAISKIQHRMERRSARQRQQLLQLDLERDHTLAKLWGHRS